MSLEKLSIQDLKKLARYFGVTKNKGKSQLISLLKKTLAEQDPEDVYIQVDSLPFKTLDKYVQTLINERAYLGALEQSRWRGNLVWLPFKKLSLFSELTGYNDAQLSVLLLLIDSDARMKRNLRIDPILETIRGRGIKDVVGNLDLEKQLEWIPSPYDLLQKSSFTLPSNIKSQYWAKLFLKELLGLEFTENEELQFKVISLFQSDDISHVKQALYLLESLFSIEEIAEFLGFELSEVFSEESVLNFLEDGEFPILEWMTWLQGKPKISGYVLLWLMGIVYEQMPEKIQFQDQHFSFYFPREAVPLEECFEKGELYESNPSLLWHDYIFSDIPPAFYQIGSISSLIPSRGMEVIPAELFCLPNLKSIGFLKRRKAPRCSDIEALVDSTVETLILDSADYASFPLPDFVWKLPKLKKLLVQNVSTFNPPPDTKIEQLKFYVKHKGFSLNFTNAKELRRIQITSKKRKIDWSWDVPQLESLILSPVGRFVLKEEAFSLREISLNSVDFISLKELPNLQSFHIGFFGGAVAHQAGTDNVFQILEQARKLEHLVFGSHATHWPEAALIWENLKVLGISRWQALQSISSGLMMPKLHKLICNPYQLELEGLPENIEHLELRNINYYVKKKFSRLEGLKRFPNLKSLELINICADFPEAAWQDIFHCESLEYLKIEKSKIEHLPQRLGQLPNLETVVLHRTNVQVRDSIFDNSPKLQKIIVQELRGEEVIQR